MTTVFSRGRAVATAAYELREDVGLVPNSDFKRASVSNNNRARMLAEGVAGTILLPLMTWGFDDLFAHPGLHEVVTLVITGGVSWAALGDAKRAAQENARRAAHFQLGELDAVRSELQSRADEAALGLLPRGFVALREAADDARSLPSAEEFLTLIARSPSDYTEHVLDVSPRASDVRWIKAYALENDPACVLLQVAKGSGFQHFLKK